MSENIDFGFFFKKLILLTILQYFFSDYDWMAYSKTKYFIIKLVNSYDAWLKKIWKIFRSYRNYPWNFGKSMYAMKLEQKKKSKLNYYLGAVQQGRHPLRGMRGLPKGDIQ